MAKRKAKVIEEILHGKSDVTSPDLGQGAVIAAVDHHEAAMTGEANPAAPAPRPTKMARWDAARKARGAK